MIDVIEKLSKESECVHPDDYIENGFVYCHKCHTQKELILGLVTGPKKVYCLCECETKARDMEAEGFNQAQIKEQIDRMRKVGVSDESYRLWKFDQDDGTQQNTEFAKAYAESFMDGMYQNGDGLLFWGKVGTGKTFLAACIANYLIDKQVPVLMTTFNKIIDEAFSVTDKAEYYRSFNQYKLLIIDDLGTQRKTDYGMEQVFNVVDDRYKSGQPIIVTTNLSLKELKEPGDIASARIYDRLLEKCTPIAFTGKNYRQELSDRKRKEMAERMKR